MAFQNKSLPGVHTLGERLAAVRTEAGISLEQAAEDTRIQINYLAALEKSAYHLLPSEVYTRSFLKKYADFLELNPASVIRLYEKEITLLEKSQRPTSRLVQVSLNLSRRYFLILPKLFRRLLLGAIIIACFSYLGYILYDAFSAPELVIWEPNDNLITTDRSLEVAGRVESDALLRINNQEIFSDQNGEFREVVNLQDGLNVIEIEARKKRGPATVIQRRVLVNKPI
ncbi:MAG: helix-turn-helix domain-containing protein [Patescibacteria group bacterium]|nr:helix-turn-helix domain-containing protein [Patescibacteria group bacterium]